MKQSCSNNPMKMIPIKPDAWMRFRSKGRYLYARNTEPIVWTADLTQIPMDTAVYCVTWKNGQHRLIANKIVNSSEIKR